MGVAILSIPSCYRNRVKPCGCPVALCVTLPVSLPFLLTQDTCEDVRINSKEERIESQVNQELEVEKVNNFTKNSKGVTIVACRPAALFRRKSCDCRLSSDYNVPIAQAFVNCKTVLVS